MRNWFSGLSCFNRWLIVSVVTLAATCCSIAWVDLPVATYMRSLDPVARDLAEPITELGRAHWPLITAACVTLAFASRRRWDLANRSAFVFFAITATLCVHLFKFIFGRARPTAYFEFGKQEPACGFDWFRVAGGRVQYTDYASFPSGHSAVAGALMVSVWLVAPVWLRWPVAVLSVLIAGSRVVKNAHWVSDTLAGLLLGGICAAVLHWRFTRRGWLNGSAGLLRSGRIIASGQARVAERSGAGS